MEIVAVSENSATVPKGAFSIPPTWRLALDLVVVVRAVVVVVAEVVFPDSIPREFGFESFPPTSCSPNPFRPEERPSPWPRISLSTLVVL